MTGTSQKQISVCEFIGVLHAFPCCVEKQLWKGLICSRFLCVQKAAVAKNDYNCMVDFSLFSSAYTLCIEHFLL